MIRPKERVADQLNDVLGARLVVTDGLPDNQVVVTSFDPASPAGDADAVVQMEQLPDGSWRVDACLYGAEAREAFRAAMLNAVGAIHSDSPSEPAVSADENKP